MINEKSLSFIKKCLNNSSIILEDIQNYVKTRNANFNDTYILLSILSDFLYNNKEETSVDKLSNMLNEYISNDSDCLLLNKLLKENLEIIKNINKDCKYSIFKSKKLVDIDWKLVSKATLEMAELGEYIPTIIVNLIFSDGSHNILETDFATFKKIQEDLDNALSSFNSSYSRKVIAFSK